MASFIEWQSEERDEVDRGDVIKIWRVQDGFKIVFASPVSWIQGHLILKETKDEQTIESDYRKIDGSYVAKAKITGTLTQIDGAMGFYGTWGNPEDGTGEWDLCIFVDHVPTQE